MTEITTSINELSRYNYDGATAENTARRAVEGVIQYSAGEPKDVAYLIELIHPSKTYLSGLEESHAEAVESLFGFERRELRAQLAEKRIRLALEQQDPATAQLISTVEESTVRAGIYARDDRLWPKDAHASILQLYVEQRNFDAARRFVDAPTFQAERVAADLELFKASHDHQDLDRARARTVYDAPSSQAEKWQQIAAATGEPTDAKQANDALEVMSRDASYRPHVLLSWYEHMHGRPGIDSERLEQVLRERTESMSQLDRTKGFLAIAQMSKKPEDDATLRAELAKVLAVDERALQQQGETSVLYQNQEYVKDAASAYGYLLQEFLDYVRDDAARRTPAHQQLAEKFMGRFERTYPQAKEHSRAREMFFWDVEGAKERVIASFQTPDQLRADLERSDLPTIYKKLRIRMNGYWRPGQAEADQQALSTIVEAIKSKAASPEELSNYLSDFTHRFMTRDKTEADLRFIHGIVESARADGVKAIYEHAGGYLYGQLAKFAAKTDEADTFLVRVKDPYERGKALAEIARARY